MSQTHTPSPPKDKKLLDQYREKIRLKQYSPRTEKTYVEWVRAYIIFHNKRHPKDMGVIEIEQFIVHLVSDKKFSGSSQNQALSAILFLYRHVLEIDLDADALFRLRPQKTKTIPLVLSKTEAKLVISKMTGVYKIIAQILYGSGLRIMEALRLRVKDIDFDNRQIIVRDGKGGDDRVTMLPESVIQPLRDHLKQVKLTYEKDLKDGFGSVYLPYALERKYSNANKEWIWQYLFPASTRYKEADSNVIRRHHLHESAVQKAVKQSARLAKIDKRIRPILFVILSQLTCFKTTMTSAPSKNYWVIRT